MSWEGKITEWESLPVTKAFFKDIQNDLNMLTLKLIEVDNPADIYRLQGMIRALQGVLDTPENDGIPSPEEEC